MRVLLLASGYRDELSDGLSTKPSPLSNVVDRPFIFHTVESLVKKGVTQIHIVEPPFSETIQSALGSGDRWGIDITYHVAGESKSLAAVLREVADGDSFEQIIVGFSGTLPEFRKKDLIMGNPDKPILFYTRDSQWCQWGILRLQVLKSLPSDILPEELIFLLDKQGFQKVSINKPYGARSLTELYETNLLLLNQRSSDLIYPTTAHQAEQGVWISRNVVIHSTAKLIAPVYIGENSRIGHGAVIGPCAVVENNCLIDRNTQVRQSVICRDSYVGVGLEVDGCLIDKNTLANIPLKTVVNMQDDFILSGLGSTPGPNRLLKYVRQALVSMRSFFYSPVLQT